MFESGADCRRTLPIVLPQVCGVAWWGSVLVPSYLPVADDLLLIDSSRQILKNWPTETRLNIMMRKKLVLDLLKRCGSNVMEAQVPICTLVDCIRAPGIEGKYSPIDVDIYFRAKQPTNPSSSLVLFSQVSFYFPALQINIKDVNNRENYNVTCGVAIILGQRLNYNNGKHQVTIKPKLGKLRMATYSTIMVISNIGTLPRFSDIYSFCYRQDGNSLSQGYNETTAVLGVKSPFCLSSDAP